MHPIQFIRTRIDFSILLLNIHGNHMFCVICKTINKHNKQTKHMLKMRQCSITCGSSGYKTRSAICVQNNKVINENECDAQSKPKDIYSSCQMDPCWRKVFESSCS